MYSFKKVTHKLCKAINPSQTISTFQLSKSKQTTHCFFFKILKWQNVGTFFNFIRSLTLVYNSILNVFTKKIILGMKLTLKLTRHRIDREEISRLLTMLRRSGSVF